MQCILHRANVECYFGTDIAHSALVFLYISCEYLLFIFLFLAYLFSISLLNRYFCVLLMTFAVEGKGGISLYNWELVSYSAHDEKTL